MTVAELLDPSQSRWTSPSGQIIDHVFRYPSSGDTNNAYFYESKTLSEFAETGTWTLSYVSVQDDAGNNEYLNTADLQSLGIRTDFEVIGAGDSIQRLFLMN